MKLRYWCYLLFCLTIISLNSCTSKSSKIERPSIYNAQDTTLVQNMVSAYLEHLKANEYDTALNMLSEVIRDSVTTVQPISDVTRSKMLSQFEVFPVLSYKLDSEDWSHTDHIVYTYTVEFFEKQPGSEIPNTVKIVLNPFRKDGYWYLSVDNRRF